MDEIRDICVKAWVRGRFKRLMREKATAEKAWVALVVEVAEFTGASEKETLYLLKRFRELGDL